MKVRDLMTREVRTAQPGETIRAVARIMSEVDTGVVPVCDGRQVLGLITDRDIVVRVVAEGLGPETAVTEVMTEQVEFCFEDDALDEVTDKMARLQIRRMVILDRDRLLAGILSLGDVAREDKAKVVGHTLDAISDPGDRPAH